MTAAGWGTDTPERHGTLLLSGVVGSVAYGLSTPTSDVDRLGVFASPTLDICGLTPPAETQARREPDMVFHEAGKFARLALACNPTVTELLWLDDYEHATNHGSHLISIRRAFLSAHRVREAYLGYACSQLRRLRSRGDGTFSADTSARTAKHARHMARLVNQGYALYTTGSLPVRVENPAWYHEFSSASETQWEAWFDSALKRFEDAQTVLPAQPDRGQVSTWLRDVRRTYLE